jgi:hypothetical protein
MELVGPDEHAPADIREDTDFAEYVAGGVIEGLFGRVCKCYEKQNRYACIGVNEGRYRPSAGKRGGQERTEGKAVAPGGRYYAEGKRIYFSDVRVRSNAEDTA